MRKITNKILLTLLLTLTFSISVHAAGVVLTPPKHEFNADPGELIKNSITITNKDTKPLILNAEVKDFVASGETGKPTFIDPKENKSNISLGKWVTVNNNETVTIEAGKKVEIPFTIQVPEDAEPGGKYGTIFFSPPSAGGQVAVVQKIGSLLLVRVSGEIKEEGTLSVFGTYDPEIKGEELESSSQDTFYEKPPVNFSVRFQNTGNVHLKPQGQIEIYNMFGQQVAPAGVLSILNEGGVEIRKELVDYIPVNDGRGNVLAQSYRKFDSEWKGTPYWYKEEDGTKVVKFKGYPIGMYTAKLELIGAKGEKILDEVKFIVFPWKEIFGGILAAIILIFGFMKYRKWSHKNLEARIRKQMESEKKNK